MWKITRCVRRWDELTDLGDGHPSLEEHNPLPASGERLHLSHPLLERRWLLRSWFVLDVIRSTVVRAEAESRLGWEPLTDELTSSWDVRPRGAPLAATDLRLEDG